MKNILKNKGTVILSFVLVVLSLFISFFSLTNNTAKADTEPSSENELTCFDDLVVGNLYLFDYSSDSYGSVAEFYDYELFSFFSLQFDFFAGSLDLPLFSDSFLQNLSFVIDSCSNSLVWHPTPFYCIVYNNKIYDITSASFSFIFRFLGGSEEILEGSSELETPYLDYLVENYITPYSACLSCGEGDCLDHLISEVAPTEDTFGAYAHYHCESCGKNFSTEDLSEIADVDLVIPKLEHNLGEWVEEVPATDTEDGTLGHYECSNCHKYFDEDFNEISDIVIPCLSSNSSSSADNGLLSLISVVGGVGLIIGISVLLSKKKKHRKK